MNKPNRWFGDLALRPEDIYARPAPAPTPDHRFKRKPSEKPTQERKPISAKAVIEDRRQG